MKKFALAVSALLLSMSAVQAADDPVAVRKALMASNGAAAGVSGGMLKGEIPYNPVVAKAVIATLNASAKAFGDYFPEGSGMDPATTASPKIWEDMAGFQTALGKFQADAGAAMEASGKSGPTDLEAFKAAVGPVLGNCKSCHESYRVQK
jgi:cytochrome c556